VFGDGKSVILSFDDGPAPRGIGDGKLAMVESQFRQQSSKSTFDVLMHVLRPTVRGLPAFIGKLA